MGRLTSIDGLPVVDAKRPLTLVIKDEDIKGGNSKRPETCAAARACARQLGADVRVHLSRIYINKNGRNWQRYATPKSLKQEIIAFDRGGKFLAGEHILPVVSPSQKALGRQQGGPDKTERASRPAVNPRKYYLVQDVRTGPPHS